MREGGGQAVSNGNMCQKQQAVHKCMPWLAAAGPRPQPCPCPMPAHLREMLAEWLLPALTTARWMSSGVPWYSGTLASRSTAVTCRRVGLGCGEARGVVLATSCCCNLGAAQQQPGMHALRTAPPFLSSRAHPLRLLLVVKALQAQLAVEAAAHGVEGIL